MTLKQINVPTRRKEEFINITHEVNRVVSDSGIAKGLCVVYVPHTTAGITINEAADPDVVRDMLMELDKIVPQSDNYRHMEGNSAAHIKTSMMGTSVQIPITNGNLILGTWQGVYFCEFDGPRSRSCIIQVMGE